MRSMPVRLYQGRDQQKMNTMDNKSTKLVSITIDGHKISAPYRASLLSVASRMGISIPTLCHHDALEPAGACRLCIVEHVRDGWSKFVTACNYPVNEGMVFRTASQEVVQYRRMTMEALLARCPNVPEIRKLALKLGVVESRFTEGDETCILCGMCTRVCETYATSAISTLNRGSDKVVGTFDNKPPEDCVGCGSCASVCPTGHIKDRREGGVYEIWEREFPVAVCGVETEKCRGCGACEEACPFRVPRVVLQKGAMPVSTIDREACRGCGVCVAACPTGAIAQPRASRDLPKNSGGILVIACGRSALKIPTSPTIPDGAHVMELPCVGGVTPAMLIGALARGHDGVLVMGRHESTCKLDGSEKHARYTVKQMERLARLVGLGEGRVQFVEPLPGLQGPTIAIADFLKATDPTPLKTTLPIDHALDGMDDALAVTRWLCERDELSIDGKAWLDSHEIPAAKSAKGSVDAGAIPYLDILLGHLLEPARLPAILGKDLEASKSRGVHIGPMPQINLQLALPPKEIAILRERLTTAQDNDIDIVETGDLSELIQYLLLLRKGSWRNSHVQPVLASDPAAASDAERQADR